jgi:hypothetical protein
MSSDLQQSLDFLLQLQISVIAQEHQEDDNKVREGDKRSNLQQHVLTPQQLDAW